MIGSRRRFSQSNWNAIWRCAIAAIFLVASQSLLCCEAQEDYDDEAVFLRIPWDHNITEPIEIMVGDTVGFDWGAAGYHDVWIHPSGSCYDMTDAIPVLAEPAIHSHVNYTFQEEDGSPDGEFMFFACEVGEGIHCEYNVNQWFIVYTRNNTRFDDFNFTMGSFLRSISG